ncbi:hypothetical protein PN36_33790 [Candidatus Thiomargarita nelsonii]|uniref:Uncharacterized protein n=1 Tax=Candidatus Thiomargarita nelsonii TaxID=1003181 RepID=A0A4E0QJN7_9GAMM|nr:hypothetical protein PN36_33790 [Candidatus Thiomargarita nelsonii]
MPDNFIPDSFCHKNANVQLGQRDHEYRQRQQNDISDYQISYNKRHAKYAFITNYINRAKIAWHSFRSGNM